MPILLTSSTAFSLNPEPSVASSSLSPPNGKILWHNQHQGRTVANDLGGHAADQQLEQPLFTVPPHDKDICIMAAGKLDNDFYTL